MRFSLRLCWNCTIFFSVIQALTMIKYAAIRATDSRVKVRKWRPEGRGGMKSSLPRVNDYSGSVSRSSLFFLYLFIRFAIGHETISACICVSNRRHNTRSFFIRFLRIKYWPFAFRIAANPLFISPGRKSADTWTQY